MLKGIKVSKVANFINNYILISMHHNKCLSTLKKALHLITYNVLYIRLILSLLLLLRYSILILLPKIKLRSSKYKPAISMLSSAHTQLF